MAIKLNQQQISTLAQKIYNDLKAPIDAHNKKVVESEEFKNFYETNTDCTYLTNLKSKYPKLRDYYVSDIMTAIRNDHFADRFLHNCIDRREVENQVILATIEAPDLENLIKIVSERFS